VDVGVVSICSGDSLLSLLADRKLTFFFVDLGVTTLGVRMIGLKLADTGVDGSAGLAETGRELSSAISKVGGLILTSLSFGNSREGSVILGVLGAGVCTGVVAGFDFLSRILEVVGGAVETCLVDSLMLSGY